MELTKELEEIERKRRLVAALESMYQRISLEGICYDDIVLAQSLAEDFQLPARYPLASFTRQPSKTNLRVGLESIGNLSTGGKVAIVAVIIGIILKVISMLTGESNSSNSSGPNIQTSTKETLEKVEKDIADNRKRKEEIERIIREEVKNRNVMETCHQAAINSITKGAKLEDFYATDDRSALRWGLAVFLKPKSADTVAQFNTLSPSSLDHNPLHLQSRLLKNAIGLIPTLEALAKKIVDYLEQPLDGSPPPTFLTQHPLANQKEQFKDKIEKIFTILDKGFNRKNSKVITQYENRLAEHKSGTHTGELADLFEIEDKYQIATQALGYVSFPYDQPHLDASDIPSLLSGITDENTADSFLTDANPLLEKWKEFNDNELGDIAKLFSKNDSTNIMTKMKKFEGSLIAIDEFVKEKDTEGAEHKDKIEAIKNIAAAIEETTKLITAISIATGNILGAYQRVNVGIKNANSFLTQYLKEYQTELKRIERGSDQFNNN